MKRLQNIFLFSILLFTIPSNHFFVSNIALNIPLHNEKQNISENDRKGILAVFNEISESEIEIEETLGSNCISFSPIFINFQKFVFKNIIFKIFKFENFKNKTPLTILYCQLKYHL